MLVGEILIKLIFIFLFVIFLNICCCKLYVVFFVSILICVMFDMWVMFVIGCFFIL